MEGKANRNHAWAFSTLCFVYTLIWGLYAPAVDLHYFRCAAEIFFKGNDPYSSQYLACLGAEIASRGLALSFPYPPSIFSLLSYMALIPAWLDSYIWALLAAAGFSLSLWMLMQLYAKDDSLSRRLVQFIYFASSPIFFLCMYHGQISFLWLAALSLYLFCDAKQTKKSEFLAGIALALLCIKPHLVLLLLAGAMAEAFAQHRWRIAAGWLGGSLMLGGLPLLVHNAYPEFLSRSLYDSLRWATPTLFSLLRNYFNLRFFIALALAVCLPIFCCLLILRRNAAAAGPRFKLLLLSAGIVITPYVWSYDFILLMPVCLYLLQSESEWTRKVLLLANLLWLMRYMFMPGKMELDVWFPIVVLALILIQLSKPPAGGHHYAAPLLISS